jgi:splicing factor U2AF 65 kDa subunit
MTEGDLKDFLFEKLK